MSGIHHPRGNSYREVGYRSSRRIRANTPSFSSSLLDEIYRSTDGKPSEGGGGGGGAKKPPSSFFKGRSEGGGGGGGEEFENGRYRRACLVEKWIQKEANERFAARRRVDSESDSLFFSSTSSSSDSSGALSDSEFFGNSAAAADNSKVSCFSSRPKPIRTGSGDKTRKEDPNKCVGVPYDGDPAKSKSRATKIYAHLKKMKQPISPGGRLTSMINSLFAANANAAAKKKKNTKLPDSGDLRYPEATQQRKSRTHRMGIVSDEDYKPWKPPLPPPTTKPSANVSDSPHPFTAAISSKIRTAAAARKHDEELDDDDDAMSDSSSDLFELDHLVLRFGQKQHQIPNIITLGFSPMKMMNE